MTDHWEMNEAMSEDAIRRAELVRARRVIKDALRDRMRLLHEAVANARHLGCENAAQCFLAAHNEASDVLAGIEAGT